MVKYLDHPQSRAKNSELVSDRPGHYKTAHTTRGKYIPRVDPRKHEHEKFAQILAEILNQNCKSKNFHELIFCMEPYFYGLLNKHLRAVVRKSLVRVIIKDYIPLSEPKLKSVLNSLKAKYGSKVKADTFC